MVKIGVDFGKNIVMSDTVQMKINSHVDLMGPAMNIAAKIQNMAKANQILIGSDVCERIYIQHLQERFHEKMSLEK